MQAWIRRTFEIKQDIEGNPTSNILKINSTIYAYLTYVLQGHQQDAINEPQKKVKLYFTPEKQKAIVDRFLKDVPLKDIAKQFDCNQSLIEQISRNKNIVIVDNKLTAQKTKFRYRRKK